QNRISKRDWSSDVCSSDLVANITFSSKDEELEKLIDCMGEKGESWELFEQDNPLNHTYIIKPKDPDRTPELAKKIAAFDYVEERSEERRVGKEDRGESAGG